MSNSAPSTTMSVIYDTPKLRVEMTTSKNHLEVRPVGIIDEDINFSIVLSTITEAIEKQEAKTESRGGVLLSFDMSQILGMNSCGVREWLLFLERIPRRVLLQFSNANELFVEQANMITNMFGPFGTPILRFQAPYHCPKCKRDEVVLLQPEHVPIYDHRAKAPEIKCTQCQQLMEFDSIEEEYFGFVLRVEARKNIKRKAG